VRLALPGKDKQGPTTVHGYVASVTLLPPGSARVGLVTEDLEGAIDVTFGKATGDPRPLSMQVALDGKGHADDPFGELVARKAGLPSALGPLFTDYVNPMGGFLLGKDMRERLERLPECPAYAYGKDQRHGISREQAMGLEPGTFCIVGNDRTGRGVSCQYMGYSVEGTDRVLHFGVGKMNTSDPFPSSRIESHLKIRLADPFPAIDAPGYRLT